MTKTTQKSSPLGELTKFAEEFMGTELRQEIKDDIQDLVNDIVIDVYPIEIGMKILRKTLEREQRELTLREQLTKKKSAKSSEDKTIVQLSGVSSADSFDKFSGMRVLLKSIPSTHIGTKLVIEHKINFLENNGNIEKIKPLDAKVRIFTQFKEFARFIDTKTNTMIFSEEIFSKLLSSSPKTVKIAYHPNVFKDTFIVKNEQRFLNFLTLCEFAELLKFYPIRNISTLLALFSEQSIKHRQEQKYEEKFQELSKQSNKTAHTQEIKEILQEPAQETLEELTDKTEEIEELPDITDGDLSEIFPDAETLEPAQEKPLSKKEKKKQKKNKKNKDKKK